MQSKMMAYDRVITELNTARLRGTSYPIVHALIDASASLSTDVSLSPIRKSFPNSL
jgi:nuclear pore complex protein Nup93